MIAPGVLNGVLLLIAALQILPFSDIMAKYLSLTLPVLQIIWARFFFHCVITGGITYVRHGRNYLLPNFSKVLVLRSSALCCAVGLFYLTLHLLPITTSLTLWFVAPFILTALAALFLHERVSAFQWFIVAAGFAGILVAIHPQIHTWRWAYSIGLLSGMFYAMFLLSTRFIDPAIPQIVSVYQTGLVGALAGTVAITLIWQAPTAFEWLMLIATGGVAAIAHILIIKAFELSDASTLAPFTYSEIIMATILGYVVFHNAPNLQVFCGLGIIIVSGIALGSRSRWARHRPGLEIALGAGSRWARDRAGLQPEPRARTAPRNTG